MRSRAKVLAAGGLSLSTLLVLAYLKRRKSQTAPLATEAVRSIKPESSVEIEFAEETATVQATVIPDETGLGCEFASKSESLTSACAELDVADCHAAADAVEAAEDSVSECENQLDEEPDAELDEVDSDEEAIAVEEAIVAEREIQALAEPAIMSAASAPLDEWLPELVAASDSNNDNNNNNSNNNNSATCSARDHKTDPLADSGHAAAAESAADLLTVVVCNAGNNGDALSSDRLNTWLARNERFCKQLEVQQLQQQQHAALCEDASDDSGRPSSVDTAGGDAAAASPLSSSAGVATATACLSQMQVSAAAVNSGNSAIVQQHHHLALSDRAVIIRGVSPVPGDDNDIIHQFLIPNKLGGSMVGTRGRNISYIRAKSGASVWISRNFFDKKTQVVNVRGPVECVKAALQVIRKRFPELDVKPINTAVPIQRNPALQPTMCQLSMPVGASVEVNVCAMCRGTTVFLQQPTHPSFHHLEKMDYTIMKHYADQASVPTLPRPVNPGAVCVAPFGAAWHRAIIADVYPEEDMVLMKYLDWGGYERMPVSSLKQIRTEMMHLPFQAVEAHLAYVSPTLTPGEEAETQLEQLSRTLQASFLANKRVKCQVVYFNDVGQPCVYLYTKEPLSDTWHFLQEDLVQAGLAQWFQMPHVAPQLPQGN